MSLAWGHSFAQNVSCHDSFWKLASELR